MASLEFNPTPAAKDVPDNSHLSRAAWTPPTEGGGGSPTPTGGTEGGGGKKGGDTTITNTNTNTNDNNNRNTLRANQTVTDTSQSTSNGSPVNIRTEVAPSVGVSSYGLPNCGTADSVAISTLFGGGSLSHTRINEKCMASNEWLAALDMANRGAATDANAGIAALSLLDKEQAGHVLPNDVYGQARARIEGAFGVQSLSNSLGSQELALQATAQKLGIPLSPNQLGALPDATIGTGPQPAQVSDSQAITVIAAAYAASGEKGVSHQQAHHRTIAQAQLPKDCHIVDGQIMYRGQVLTLDNNDNLVDRNKKVVAHIAAAGK